MARTRIPTPHGPAFLHVYHNNRDNKEHLAIVVDHAQHAVGTTAAPASYIRSHTLDAVWSDDETEMDRLTRGAYAGRLAPEHAVASSPVDDSELAAPAALARIHSECFTGETIGSQRCDCGEQLDEALRLLSHAGRGAVVYLRQEGRGIGLLDKVRAYNLQDLGHDTVSANLALGHRADERGYELAGAILRDLSLGDGVRLLTNNPDKVRALAAEGINVVERVPMVPRSWREVSESTSAHSEAPSTVVGGGAVRGQDLDKYLRTKVSRMGHMLSLPGGSLF
jgi:GTP cyclohydrolase II